MSAESKDGGSAFPQSEYGELGMSLRDYFAGQAISAMRIKDAGSWIGGVAPTELTWQAQSAYAVADEMLKERNLKS